MAVTPEPATPVPATPEPAIPSAEDAKLVTLARSVLARTGADQGAAARDEIGRTYVAASVGLPSLRLSAVQAVVAVALSSGAPRLDTVAVVGGADQLSDDDRALLEDVSVASVLLFAADGTAKHVG